MSIEAKKATPHKHLVDELMDSRIPKTEREHAAAREIKRLRQAIAEAEKQEPVCDKDPQGCWNVRCQLGKVCKNAHPQPKREWVGLTEEERATIIRLNSDDAWGAVVDTEAKLQEKNT